MRSRLTKFFRRHTPAGRYLNEVEKGIEIQKARLEEGAEWPERLRAIVAQNNISAHFEQLLMGRRP